MSGLLLDYSFSKSDHEIHMKEALKKFPPMALVSSFFWRIRNARKESVSRGFWEARYAEGGTSGPGSYGQLADFKATTINEIVSIYSVDSIIDFGCGDGNQLRNINQVSYLGFDVSSDAVNRCQAMYSEDASKQFMAIEAYRGQRATMAMSLDVIFHLVEDVVFEEYMRRLFGAADQLVLVYSSNFEQFCFNPFAKPSHVRHRKFTHWIENHAPEWSEIKVIENPYKLHEGVTPKTHSVADFYLFAHSSLSTS